MHYACHEFDAPRASVESVTQFSAHRIRSSQSYPGRIRLFRLAAVLTVTLRFLVKVVSQALLRFGILSQDIDHTIFGICFLGVYLYDIVFCQQAIETKRIASPKALE